MIAIDTNVLLRYLLADDEQQYSKARNLITSHPPVLITDVVLVETIWIIDSNRGWAAGHGGTILSTRYVSGIH